MHDMMSFTEVRSAVGNDRRRWLGLYCSLRYLRSLRTNKETEQY